MMKNDGSNKEFTLMDRIDFLEKEKLKLIEDYEGKLEELRNKL